jgi:hypothetical protein
MTESVAARVYVRGSQGGQLPESLAVLVLGLQVGAASWRVLDLLTSGRGAPFPLLSVQLEHEHLGRL